MKYILNLLWICSVLLANTPIFMLHSYHEGYQWTVEQNDGFISVINNDDTIQPDYSSEYLDTKRRGLSKGYDTDTLAYLLSKYKQYTPELIYVTDDNALHFMLSHKDVLFPSTPIVFSGVNNLNMEKLFPNTNAIGIFEKKDMTKNIDLLNKLFPKEKELLIIGDDSLTSRMIAEDMKSYTDFYPALKVKYLLNSDFLSLIEYVKSYKGQNIILTSIGAYKSTDGSVIKISEVIDAINKLGEFFILALETTYITNGVIGGYCNDGVVQGAAAAEIALQLLKNKRQFSFTSYTGPSTWIIDKQAIDTFNIELPQEVLSQTKFINLRPSFYQENERFITSLVYTLAILLFLGAIIFSYMIVRSKTKIKKSEKKLAILSQRLNKAQEITHLGNWDWDIKTDLIWWSDEVYRIFGIEVNLFIPNYDDFIKYIHPLDVLKVEGAIANSLETGAPYSITHRILRSNGELRYVREEGILEKDSLGNPLKMTGTVQDITTETLMHIELERIATTDKLTGIHNRHKFEELFILEEERAKRFSHPLSLIVIDIDKFKSVNDQYGHSVGDSVIIEFTKVVKINIRNIDIFARWGGEEFLILSPETNIQDMKHLAEKLRLSIENTSFHMIDKMTISIGLTTYKGNDSFKDAFLRADRALYRAKNNGRNQIAVEE